MAIGPIQKAKSTHKGRKIGRNKAWCESYRRAMRHEKSHIRRLLKHTVSHPNDAGARHALSHFCKAAGIRGAA